MGKNIRVLVIDDSAYVRKVVTQMLSRSPLIEVVGTARDGHEALELVEKHRPDVVTVDLMMPLLDGPGFLREQMKRNPLPAIIVSIASEKGEAVLEALEAGAIDFVQKPTALATEKIFEIADDLIEKIMAAASARPGGLHAKAASAVVRSNGKQSIDLVAIGISTGGPQALKRVIPRLPKDLPVPVAIVLHMPVGYTDLYAQKLNESSGLHVMEAREGEIMQPGKVILAQAGRHLKFIRQSNGDIVVHLDAQPFDALHRPSVDVMFQSAAEQYKSRILGVVMTGMGSDGHKGAAWIKAQGGKVFTEAEESCIVYGMPRTVVEAGLSDRSVPLDKMAEAIVEAL